MTLLASLVRTYLHDSLLIFHSFPFELLTCLSGVSEFRFVEVAAAPGSWQVLLQLPDGDLHLLQLGMVLLSPQTAHRGHQWGEKTALQTGLAIKFSQVHHHYDPPKVYALWSTVLCIKLNCWFHSDTPIIYISNPARGLQAVITLVLCKLETRWHCCHLSEKIFCFWNRIFVPQ